MRNTFIRTPKTPKDELETISQAPLCPHCKQDRVMLYLLPSRKMLMRVCVNDDCFHYANLAQIHSWKR